MARGLPALWSTLLGAPAVAGGLYLFRYAPPSVTSGTPPWVGLVVAAFGLFVVGMGVYVHFVTAPEAPETRGGEELAEERTPALRHALGQALVGLPILGLGGYLLYFTARPLVQPTVALAVGLYLFSTGLYRYWRNTLTTYFLTTRRVIEEYRFISLLRNEVPLAKVRGVEENQSAWDALFGLGNVAVRSGASGGLTVSVDEVYDHDQFARRVRTELGPEEATADDGADESVATEDAGADGPAATDRESEPATAGGDGADTKAVETRENGDWGEDDDRTRENGSGRGRDGDGARRDDDRTGKDGEAVSADGADSRSVDEADTAGTTDDGDAETATVEDRAPEGSASGDDELGADDPGSDGRPDG